MSLQRVVFVTVLMIVTTTVFSQRRFEEYNRLGLTGGVNLFDIQTDQFLTSQGTGVTAEFTTRGSFYNNFDLIYGIGFYQQNVDISTYVFFSEPEMTPYTISGVQVKLLGSYNIIQHHLSLEFGPILHINGKMKLKNSEDEERLVTGYNGILSQDLEDITKVNFRVMGGITAGLKSFRLSAHYQYGVTNMLNKLNEQNFAEERDFEGKSSTIVLTGTFYF
ncbi:outer membrane beta-barrel protein [Altibacter sp. HG106]|uniref:outer membrane beta-barrel protein n=1 Tax=Altibacter sp. HG106 TaxID=3023937 RepID=UPI00235080A0|nr:outer membrane beta-barrel protein [Altibacter sp. HG106]MDC7994983.1 outer membrane beta-barrel protein [Altibacter sp. HG106]